MAGKRRYTDAWHELMAARTALTYERLKGMMEGYAAAFPGNVMVQVSGLRAGQLKCRVGRRAHYVRWSKDRLKESRVEAFRQVTEKRELEKRVRHEKYLAKLARLKIVRDRKHAKKERERAEKSRLLNAAREMRRLIKEKNVREHEGNMTLSRRRKEARKLKDDFCEQWEKDYGFLFRRSEKAQKKRDRIKRDLLAKARRDPKVWQIRRHIHNNPCSCYWCGVFMPDGGEVDHVVPLAKGGDDGYGNLVPSCQNCNRVKQAGMPNGAELRVSPQLEIPLVV